MASANSDECDKDKSIKNGADNHIFKPLQL